MDPYRLARPWLFRLDAETAHDLVMGMLGRASRHDALLGQIERRHADRLADNPVQAMGLRFANPVGLAAGLDKQAAAAPALAALGFGFVELGTVTPEPQRGNPRPRMFRLEEDGAIVNRMGFNSCGVDTFLANLRRRRPRCITGINIGKNAATAMSAALTDYRMALRAVYDDADYVTINISSPNTRDLRALQEPGGLVPLLSGIRRCRVELAEQTGRRVPIAVKIAPDLDDGAIAAIAEACLRYDVDGIIATNTTVARPASLASRHAAETGGLSGAPLTAQALHVVETLARVLDGALPIIAAGGIMRGEDAVARLQAGATLVQLYTGFVYRGPALVREAVEALAGRT